MLGAFTSPLPVLHRHTETFEIPHGATHLAMSAFYDRQAFRIGRYGYGIQFHPEIDGDAPELATVRAAGRVLLAAFAALALAVDARRGVRTT